MARPKKPAEERAALVIGVRLTPADKALVDAMTAPGPEGQPPRSANASGLLRELLHREARRLSLLPPDPSDPLSPPAPGTSTSTVPGGGTLPPGTLLLVWPLGLPLPMAPFPMAMDSHPGGTAVPPIQQLHHGMQLQGWPGAPGPVMGPPSTTQSGTPELLDALPPRPPTAGASVSTRAAPSQNPIHRGASTPSTEPPGAPRQLGGLPAMAPPSAERSASPVPPNAPPCGALPAPPSNLNSTHAPPGPAVAPSAEGGSTSANPSLPPMPPPARMLARLERQLAQAEGLLAKDVAAAAGLRPQDVSTFRQGRTITEEKRAKLWAWMNGIAEHREEHFPHAAAARGGGRLAC